MASFDPTVLLATHWDARDVESFVDAFADDSTWTVNASPPAVGKQAIKDLAQGIMSSSKSSRHFDLHVVVQTVPLEAVTVCHGAVEYEMEGKNKNVVCRFCDVFELDNDKIVKCWTYMDTAPLSA